MTETFVYRSWI